MKLLVRQGNIRNIFCLSVLFTFLFLSVVDSYGQGAGNFSRPQLPKLSLMGEDESYNTDYYPDGRIWVPPSVSGAREFLLPVFITNNWFSYKNAQGIALYRVEPITSFEFSIFYNEKAVRAIGVETVHPSYVDVGVEPLAKNFTIKTDDFEDDYYWYFINPNKWNDTRDNEDGRRIRITGVSNQGLPETDPISVTYEVLLYVRFRVVADNRIGQINLIQTTPIYIDNRVVRYNDMNVATDYAWQHMLDYDTTNYLNLYNRPKIGNNRGRLDGNLFMPETYLDGLNNAPVSEDDNAKILPGPLVDDAMFKTEPVYPGVITLKISDDVPRFRVASITDDEFPKNPEGSEYEIPYLVSVDDNSPDQFGIARIKITNRTTKSRLQNVFIETDQEWLRVNTDPLNENRGLQIKNNGRDGFIKWIDNAILGQELDPILKPTQDDGDVILEVRCDPTRLPKVAGEVPHGIHVGYITLKSDYARVSPVRIKVTFLFIRNPYEPDWAKAPQNPGGINVSLINRIGQQVNLVFGTGDRATESVDELYGEFAWGQPMNTQTLDARWFPTNPALETIIPYGFGDFAPNILNRRTNSRDIRPYNLPKGVNSWVYKCKFNNLDANYPVTVQWNTRDFPVGSTLFIRTVLEGQAGQAISMYQATPINETVRSITITDTRIKEFWIEYTLPQSINFVDENGNPIIKSGWNLLSLPLNPENRNYKVVYPKAINIPWAFVNSQYQQRELLRFGEGYFVKYPESGVDTKFAGAFVREINDAYGIKVFGGDTPDPGETQFKGGWNLVGALSVVTSINGIEFLKGDAATIPSKSYTLKYGVYGYRTDLGYYLTSNLIPGLGYWIKTSGDGIYTLKSTYESGKENVNYITKEQILNNSQTFIIRDNAKKEAKLYMTNLESEEVNYFEYPPIPMAGLFDVRFADNKYLTNSNEATIRLQGVDYPINLNVTNSDANYKFVDAATGILLGEVKKGETANIKVNELAFNAIKVYKSENSEIALNNANIYPNPAQNLTNIEFTITQNAFVTIDIYDALGNKVDTIVNNGFNAGSYSQTFDVTNLANGIYYAKVNAGEYNTVIKFNVVK